MPNSMNLAEHLAVIRENTAALQTDARSVSMTDLVPTCPGWTVADLLEHHGGVCRWAATIVSQGRTKNLSEEELEALVPTPGERADLLTWYAHGAAQLITSFESPGPNVGLVFLQDAPSPRAFWARRSAHETTIHRVDVLAANLGHLPTAAGTGISKQLGLDGIDELLMGFVPRRSSSLRAQEPVVVNIVPNDDERSWNVTISTEPPVSAPGSAPEAEATLTGSAVALYLGLWNRGDEIAEHGQAPVLGLWREKVRVSWA